MFIIDILNKNHYIFYVKLVNIVKTFKVKEISIPSRIDRII